MNKSITNFDIGLEALKELDEAHERFFKNISGSSRILKLINRLTVKNKFKDEATERSFREKDERVRTATALGVPDRVPVITGGLNYYPAYYAGISFRDYIFDSDKCKNAYLTFVRDFSSFDQMFPGQNMVQFKLFADLGMRNFKFPGIDLDNNEVHQFVETEQLSADEYAQFMEEGSEFFTRVLMPRISSKFHPKRGFNKKLMFKIFASSISYCIFFNRITEIVEKKYGLPTFYGGLTPMPFDYCSFLFRGLHGMARDFFKHPEEITWLADWLTPYLLELVVDPPLISSGKKGMVIMVERAFSMSPRQFGKFALPSLKKFVNAINDRGVHPVLALEEDCTHIYEYLLELPQAKFSTMIDKGDIFKAKRSLQGHSCIIGNVPQDLLVVGKPKDIKEYCKRLIHELAPGGGFILGPALTIPENAKAENVHAMLEYTLEHGKY